MATNRSPSAWARTEAPRRRPCVTRSGPSHIDGLGVIKFKPTADPVNAPYPDSMQIGSGEEFAILGVGTTRSRFVPPTGLPHLDVTGGVAYLDFVELAEKQHRERHRVQRRRRNRRRLR